MARRLTRLWTYCRLLCAPRAGLDTAEGRGQERLRMVALATLAGGLAKAASGLTMVVSIAATSRHLGQERFGLWMTLMSFMTLLAFADFGLNSGLVNAISDSCEDARTVQAAIANGVAMLCTVSLGLGAVAAITFRLVNWATFFNLHDPIARVEAPAAMAVFIAILLLTNVVSFIQRIQIGLQLAWRASMWAAMGQILGLTGVLLVVREGGGVPWLVAALGGGPALMWILNGCDFFLRTHPQYRPTFAAIHRRQCQELVGSGLFFMWLESMALIGNASDNIIIARILGAAAVASYAVAQKLAAALFLGQFFGTPLWPAFGDALARGETAWARKILSRALLLSIGLGAIAALIIRCAGASIIALWAGSAVVPSAAILNGFAAISLMLPVISTLSAFLNTSRNLRKQAVYYPIASLVALGLMIFWTAHWHQAAGAAWGKFAGYSGLFIVPGLVIAYRSSRPQVALAPGSTA